MMTNNMITDETLDEIASLLPLVLKRALTLYDDLLKSMPDAVDCKQYSAYYTVCKLALSHLEALINLLEQLNKRLIEANRQDDLARLLSVAHKEVNTFRVKEEVDDG